MKRTTLVVLKEADDVSGARKTTDEAKDDVSGSKGSGRR